MDPNHSKLVVMDFPGIKEYVFGTQRLVEIRGASALLDYLNRKLIPENMKKHFGPSRCETIFAGGGAAQFIVEADSGEIKEQFLKIQGEVYKRSGGGVRLTAGIADIYNKNYSDGLEQAVFDLKRDGQRNPLLPCSTLHTGLIRECDSCSGMAATISRYGNEKRWLCQKCTEKEKNGQRRGLWKGFGDYIKKDIFAWRAKDFEEIGQRCEARSGYTALVYGDGNAMGRIVRQIDTKKRFQAFSQAVDEAVREACYEALWLHCKPVKGKIPADILLLGGDDLMVYLSAEKALDFAIDTAELFEEKTRKKLCQDSSDDFFSQLLNGKGLTLSTGIAFAKTHTPISIMADQAEELLSSAKKKEHCLREMTPIHLPALISI